MRELDQRREYAAVAAGARAFALLALAPPVAITGNYGTILSLVFISIVWMAASIADGLPRLPVMPAMVVEASLVSFLVGLSLLDTTVLVPALAIPVFVGGMVRGSVGIIEVLGAELAILAAVIAPNSDLATSRALLSVLFTWLMVGLGLGMIAAVIRRAKEHPRQESSYRDARRLLQRLLDLSGELAEGLDPVSISRNIVALTREEVPLVGCVVYVEAHGTFVPLIEGDDNTAITEHRTALLRTTMLSGRPSKAEQDVGVPLLTEAGLVGVLVGHLPSVEDPADLQQTLSALADRLRPEALQLDTALLFSAVRDSATAEERQRLAREMHDGVAQDLASLGYLVDDLTASAPNSDLREQCEELRGELSTVIGELRRSVFSLRNRGAGSLGQSIQELARRLEARSGITVSVERREGGERLLPEVEAELLRIAQEGVNNAIRHAQASRITVTCEVEAPRALVVVEDDGRGLQPGRDDSHGLRIMHERARRIGAQFDIGPRPHGRGTRLVVRTSPAAGPAGGWEEEESVAP